LESFNAKLYLSDLSEEAEQAVAEAAENEAIAKAVDAEYTVE
jgi:hypothetical protein